MFNFTGSLGDLLKIIATLGGLFLLFKGMTMGGAGKGSNSNTSNTTKRVTPTTTNNSPVVREDAPATSTQQTNNSESI